MIIIFLHMSLHMSRLGSEDNNELTLILILNLAFHKNTNNLVPHSEQHYLSEHHDVYPPLSYFGYGFPKKINTNLVLRSERHDFHLNIMILPTAFLF